MYSDVSSITATTSLIALFSLMWFVTGIFIGRVMPEGLGLKPSGGSSRGGKSSKGRQRSSRGAGRGDGSSRNSGSKPSVKGAVELYVGNLPYSMGKKDIIKVFSDYGSVVSVRLIENRSNGKPKGFGFIEMDSQSSADKAIKGLHSTKVNGRAIVVSEAKSRERDR